MESLIKILHQDVLFFILLKQKYIVYSKDFVQYAPNTVAMKIFYPVRLYFCNFLLCIIIMHCLILREFMV